MNDATVVDGLRDSFFDLKSKTIPGHDYISFKLIISIIFFDFIVE